MPAAPVTLVPGHPVSTPEPLLLVAGLHAPGLYTFQLVVIDDVGLESAPGRCTVMVHPG